MKEVWKPVVGWKGLYEVSSLGRVRSLPRRIKQSNGVVIHIKGKILKTPVGNHGYPRCGFFRRGRGVIVSVHVIVALSFHGKCPAGQEVRHRDGKKKNNRDSNLKYGTRADNEADKVRHGTSNRGERSGSAILKRDQVIEIRRRYSTENISQKNLGSQYGVSENAIHHIVNRSTWAWL